MDRWKKYEETYMLLENDLLEVENQSEHKKQCTKYKDEIYKYLE